eukprot:scaffold295932_cov15-Tisochrysis_lutea.AAC.1
MRSSKAIILLKTSLRETLGRRTQCEFKLRFKQRRDWSDKFPGRITFTWGNSLETGSEVKCTSSHKPFIATAQGGCTLFANIPLNAAKAKSSGSYTSVAFLWDIMSVSKTQQSMCIASTPASV